VSSVNDWPGWITAVFVGDEAKSVPPRNWTGAGNGPPTPTKLVTVCPWWVPRRLWNTICSPPPTPTFPPSKRQRPCAGSNRFCGGAGLGALLSCIVTTRPWALTLELVTCPTSTATSTTSGTTASQRALRRILPPPWVENHPTTGTGTVTVLQAVRDASGVARSAGGLLSIQPSHEIACGFLGLSSAFGDMPLSGTMRHTACCRDPCVAG